ncbi:MAG: hypothetical protein Q9190_001305 [Brigantiaea leucoxantha]
MAAKTENLGSDDVLEIKNAIYARCASKSSETIFSQSDILGMKVIPQDDLHLLLKCTQQLTREGLFKLMTREGRAVWKVVKKEDAAKYKTLSSEEALVYSYIESSGREGIWSKLIRSRSNLHMAVVTRCLKTLESKNYIKQITSMKFPNKKTYMLAGLQPSEDATGGPFYTDGILDDEFVHQMAHWTERYILGRSWWFPPLSPPKESSASRSKSHQKPEENDLTREEAEELRNIELRKKQPLKERSENMLPMPPDYTNYPTVSDITAAINRSGLSGVVMKELEMKQLLDVMRWDGKVERVADGRGGYRATRHVMTDENHASGNALTEAPCGRCPVAYLCREDGPVNASTCEYFQDWLEM